MSNANTNPGRIDATTTDNRTGVNNVVNFKHCHLVYAIKLLPFVKKNLMCCQNKKLKPISNIFELQQVQKYNIDRYVREPSFCPPRALRGLEAVDASINPTRLRAYPVRVGSICKTICSNLTLNLRLETFQKSFDNRESVEENNVRRPIVATVQMNLG